jgi:hypothetical protein
VNFLRSIFPFLLCFLLGSAGSHAEMRSWTDVTGRVIQAEFVSANATEVRVRLNGRETGIPLAKLSDADRRWIAEKVAAAAKPGVYSDEPFTHRWFQGTEALQATPQAKLAAAYFDKFHDEIQQLQPQIKRVRPSVATRYALSDHHYYLEIPEGFTNDGSWGVYLHMSPADQAAISVEWKDLLKKHKLVAISPHHGGNNFGEWFRCLQALDSLASVQKKLQLKQGRTVIGGFSGGGFMALWTFCLYPDLFVGVVAHGKEFPLKKKEVPGKGIYAASMPFIKEAGDWKRITDKKKPWVFAIGDEDPNYPLVREQLPEWNLIGQPTELLTMPGKGHVMADAATMNKAMERILGLPEGARP